MNQNLIAEEIQAVMPAVIATGLLVSLFTAQAPTGALDASGVPTGAFADVAGLVDIRCTAPPTSEAKITATEAKQLFQIGSSEDRHVLLDAYYPTLDAGWRAGWRCVIDGTIWDLLGVEHDSQFQMSRVSIHLGSV